jgi:hypothetical protein
MRTCTRRNFVVSTAQVAMLAATACSTVATRTAAAYVPPRQGSTWTHARVDMGSYGAGAQNVTSTRIDMSWEGRDVIGLRSAEGTLLMTPAGEWLAQLNASGAVMVSWSPPLVWAWPIREGKSWQRSYTATFHPSRRQVSYEVDQTVEAYERIDVPAGTFDVFRIRSRDTLGNEDQLWFQPDLGVFAKLQLQRTARHAQGSGRRDVELVSQTILPT